MNYDIDEFNKDGILNPGIFLIIVCAYLSRYLLYGPLSLIASRRLRSAGGKTDLSFLTVDSPFEMLTSIPAVILIFLMLARSKNSGDTARWLWRNGKHLLLFCAVSQSGLILLDLIDMGKLTLPLLSAVLFNVFALLYLTTNQRVKDVFSMFPEKAKSAAKN